MSMLSSDYNVCANVLTADVYRRYIRPGASQKELVLAGRLATMIVGFLALGAALLLAGGGGEKQFRNMVTLFSTMAAPVALPMLLGLLWRQVTNAAALTGFLLGTTVGFTLLWKLPDELAILGTAWKRENLILLCSCIGTLTPIVVMSLLARMSERERDRIAPFFERLATPIGGLAEDRAPPSPVGPEIVSPFRVVGICVVVIGLIMLAVQPWIEAPLAGTLNLTLGAGFSAIGGLMIWRGRRPRTPRGGA
jgi:hypothetical protein